ncbi:MAG: universal stress protein [Acidimicrobiales bacterium]
MQQLRQAHVGGDDVAVGGGRPVLLATFFSVPFDHDASVLAVDSAIESGQPLIVVNVVRLEPLPASVHLGVDHLKEPPEVDAALRAPAELAHSCGLRVERLLVKTPRPVTALLEVVSERKPGLLVLGSDPSRLPRRFARRAWKAARENAGCLVSRAGDGPEDLPPNSPGDA